MTKGETGKSFSSWMSFSSTISTSSIISAKPWRVDLTGDLSYPPWNHPPHLRDTGTELSAIVSRPTFIWNTHFTSF